MSQSPLPARTLMFDLDGTLIDTVPDIAAAANRAMRALGLTQRPLEDLRRWIGNGSHKLIKRTITGEWDGEPDPALFDQALALFFDLYAEHIWEESRFYPGVEDTVARFHDEGFSLACVTNKPLRHTALLLEVSGLSHHIPLWVGGDSLPVRKPEPDQLLHAAERLGSAAEDCVMVGDSVNDILAARAAGMPVICLTYGYNQGVDLSTKDPDRLLDRFADLADHVVYTDRGRVSLAS